MSKLAKFYVDCYAKYPVEVELPEEFFDGDDLAVDGRTLMQHLADHISEYDASNLEFVDDADCDPIYSTEVIVDNKIKCSVYVDGKVEEVEKVVEQDTFTITCYNTTETFPESERQAQIREYQRAMMCCEGSERDRYTNIYLDLVEGKKVCKDEEDW